MRAPSFAWSGIRDARTLPAAYNPESGYIASANNQPSDADIPIGYFFAASDRVERLADLIENGNRVDFERAKSLQQDVYLRLERKASRRVHAGDRRTRAGRSDRAQPKDGRRSDAHLDGALSGR